MQFPKPTPLQSRFAASCAASLILVILYLAFSSPHFAYALEADSIERSDHNHPLILDLNDYVGESRLLPFGGDEDVQGYEPEFSAMGRSIVGKAPTDPQLVPLQNNVPGKSDISMGDSQHWTFPSSALYGPQSTQLPQVPSPRKREISADEQDHLDLKRRQQNDRTLYLTLNVCDQPSPVNGNPAQPPPQLKFFVSTDPNNKFPGDNSGTLRANAGVPVDGGWAEFQSNTSSDVYITIEAQTDSSFQGKYNYELTASNDYYYTYSEGFSSMQWSASDGTAASFTVPNTTSIQGAPFGIFVHNQGDVMIQGVSKSYCGMKNKALIQGNLRDAGSGNVTVLTSTTLDNVPIQQFYVSGLNTSSSYIAMMAIASNYSGAGSGQVNGGGTVWQNITFSTTNDVNCRVIYNISTCPGFSYKVPANATIAITDLQAFYENMTFALYQPFSYAFQQIPCETEDSAKYSLAVTCDDCRGNYTRWFCAVTMPRCESIDYQGSSTQVRNIGQPFPNNNSMLDQNFISSMLPDNATTSLTFNRSRNTDIDGGLNPGPYTEILPCPNLCYGLVRACPASLGFGCPTAPLLYASYGNDSNTCNWAGAPSGARMVRVPRGLVILGGVVGALGWVLSSL